MRARHIPLKGIYRGGHFRVMGHTLTIEHHVNNGPQTKAKPYICRAMPKFNWKPQRPPWVAKPSPSSPEHSGGGGAGGTRSPHAKDKRYNSARWKRLRLLVLRDSPLCANCHANHRIEPAKVVDHIVRVRDGGEFWDIDNLQTLCQRCHNSKSGRESHGLE